MYVLVSDFSYLYFSSIPLYLKKIIQLSFLMIKRTKHYIQSPCFKPLYCSGDITNYYNNQASFDFVKIKLLKLQNLI